MIDIASPADLLDVVKWLKANGADIQRRAYRTVVLDGLSTFVLEKVASRPEKDLRRATKEANKELIPALHTFLTLPYIRVLTAHARFDEQEIVTADGEKLVKVNVCPDLPPRIRLFVEGRVHAFGYCYAAHEVGANNSRSKVWWLPYDSDNAPRPRSIAAGNRLGLPMVTDLTYEAIYKAVVKNGNN